MRKLEVIGVAVVACGAAVAFGQSFQGLGPAPGSSTSIALGISGDGSTVVGRSMQYAGSNTPRAWQWNAQLGMRGVTTPEDWVFDEAGAASFDGSVIAGYGGPAALPRSFRSVNGQTTVEPVLTYATNISHDGNVIVGYRNIGIGRAARWSASTGVTDFGPLQGGLSVNDFLAVASAASFDGSVIVGTARVQVRDLPQVFESTPFIWTQANGARTVPAVDGSLPKVVVTDLNPSGDVFVGFDISVSPNRITRWSATAGYQIIAPLLPLTGYEPKVSADGNTIIAGLNYWTASGGVRDLRQVLIESGCDFTGWSLTQAVGISDDGRTIAGNGVNPQGQNQAWVAVIPAPGTLVVLAGVGVVGRRRRGS